MQAKAIADKLKSLEGKLNSFGTLVNDNQPEYRQTLEAVYAELEELKALINEPKDSKAAT